MLSDGEMAAMRATLIESFPDTCDVIRAALVRDDQGGATATYAPVESGVPCRVAPAGLTPDEREMAARLGGAVTWTLTVPVDTDISAADRVDVAGRVFEVAGVLGPRSWEVARRVTLVEVA